MPRHHQVRHAVASPISSASFATTRMGVSEMTEITADAGHAIIAPSSLDRTVHCPGWLKNATTVPALPEGEEAAEGEAAHWVALQMALAAVPGNGELPAVGSKAPNGVVVTDEMIDGGFIYVEALEG